MNFFSTFIIIWILVALVTFIYLFYVDAPYGRHIRTGWGKNISARVGWVVMTTHPTRAEIFLPHPVLM